MTKMINQFFSISRKKCNFSLIHCFILFLNLIFIVLKRILIKSNDKKYFHFESIRLKAILKIKNFENFDLNYRY